MTIPKRIVFSRKGFDSGAGRKPSPIFDGKRLLSLPIPEDIKKTIRYSDISDPIGQFPSLGPVVEQLTNGELHGDSFAHLDPDLRPNSLSTRLSGWLQLFGQVDQSQTHLCNQGVGAGDLFLFFGLYRDVEVAKDKIRYVRGTLPKHVIWGWLAVGDVLKPISERDDPEWARYHPHFTDQRSPNNTVYVAADRVFETLPGAGVFDNYRSELCLTDEAQRTASLWRLPRWCAPRDGHYPFTYHQREERYCNRNNHVMLQTTGRGQEFVLHTKIYSEAVEWAKGLLKGT